MYKVVKNDYLTNNDRNGINVFYYTFTMIILILISTLMKSHTSDYAKV